MARKDRTGNRKSREQRPPVKLPELGYYLVLKFGCILIMVRCRLLWNHGYAAVSLKRFLKKTQVKDIQSQIR